MSTLTGALTKAITINLYDTDASSITLEVSPKTKFIELLPLLQSEVQNLLYF
jgi:hypothetical protein